MNKLDSNFYLLSANSLLTMMLYAGNITLRSALVGEYELTKQQISAAKFFAAILILAQTHAPPIWKSEKAALCVAILIVSLCGLPISTTIGITLYVLSEYFSTSALTIFIQNSRVHSLFTKILLIGRLGSIFSATIENSIQEGNALHRALINSCLFLLSIIVYSLLKSPEAASNIAQSKKKNNNQNNIFYIAFFFVVESMLMAMSIQYEDTFRGQYAHQNTIRGIAETMVGIGLIINNRNDAPSAYILPFIAIVGVLCLLSQSIQIPCAITFLVANYYENVSAPIIKAHVADDVGDQNYLLVSRTPKYLAKIGITLALYFIDAECAIIAICAIVASVFFNEIKKLFPEETKQLKIA